MKTRSLPDLTDNELRQIFNQILPPSSQKMRKKRPRTLPQLDKNDTGTREYVDCRFFSSAPPSTPRNATEFIEDIAAEHISTLNFLGRKALPPIPRKEGSISPKEATLIP